MGRKKRNGSMNNLKQRLALKMKQEKQAKNERSESMDMRSIRKRKTKRKIRQNIFETANAMNAKEQMPKYIPKSEEMSNEKRLSAFSLSKADKINESEDEISDSASDSDSSSSSSSSSAS